MGAYREEHEPKGIFSTYSVFEINKLHSTPDDLKLLYGVEVPYQWDSENQTFMGLVLNDDSMSPEYLKNDIVVVTEMKTLSGDGDYIIQLLKKSGAKTYFRRIKITTHFRTIYNVFFQRMYQIGSFISFPISIHCNCRLSLSINS